MGGVAMPSAKAADLGGDCCADLEERVAELEATTARKGNRKMSLTITGQVNRMIMFWDDGRDEGHLLRHRQHQLLVALQLPRRGGGYTVVEVRLRDHDRRRRHLGVNSGEPAQRGRHLLQHDLYVAQLARPRHQQPGQQQLVLRRCPPRRGLGRA